MRRHHVNRSCSRRTYYISFRVVNRLSASAIRTRSLGQVRIGAQGAHVVPSEAEVSEYVGSTLVWHPGCYYQIKWVARRVFRHGLGRTSTISHREYYRY